MRDVWGGVDGGRGRFHALPFNSIPGSQVLGVLRTLHDDVW